MGAERELAVIARNFEQAAATYESAALVQNAMGAELLAVLARTGLTVTGQALELGCGPGNFTERLLSALPLQRLTLNDLSPLLVERAQARASGCVVDSVVGDLTTAPVAAPFRDYDLIISNATFQWFADLDRALVALRLRAHPEGLLVYSSFLDGTMRELTELLGRGLNYLTEAAARDILARHCTLLHFCTKTVVQHFDSSFHLLRHFKATGVNSVSATPLSAGELRRFMLRYEQQYSDASGAIPLTWQPYFVVARWRP